PKKSATRPGAWQMKNPWGRGESSCPGGDLLAAPPPRPAAVPRGRPLPDVAPVPAPPGTGTGVARGRMSGRVDFLFCERWGESVEIQRTGLFLPAGQPAGAEAPYPGLHRYPRALLHPPGHALPPGRAGVGRGVRGHPQVRRRLVRPVAAADAA